MKEYNCWIIYNGNLQEEKFVDLAQWLDDAAKKHDVTSKLVKNNELFPTVENGCAVIKGTSSLLPDFIIFLDKDIALAKHFELMGIPVFNSSECISNCDNKALTFQMLANNGIPMPKTLLAPLTFTEHGNLEPFDVAIEELGFPLVLKEAYGSFGMQVFLIHSKEDLHKKIKEIGNKPFLLQQFIQSSYGKDIRLNVVGNEVVASMKRISETDFRANVSNGGRMEVYEPTNEEKELAIKCASLVGADFAGVDLLFGEGGSPIVCEINSNAHIRNIYNCTGVNVAEFIIPHVLKKVTG